MATLQRNRTRRWCIRCRKVPKRGYYDARTKTLVCEACMERQPATFDADDSIGLPNMTSWIDVPD